MVRLGERAADKVREDVGLLVRNRARRWARVLTTFYTRILTLVSPVF